MNPVEDAIAIWKAGVAAVDPQSCMNLSLSTLLLDEYYGLYFRSAPAIRVVGAGKAGAKMALGLESDLARYLDKIIGLVNVPEGVTEKPEKIRLRSARPAGSNFPTQAGVDGADEMLRLLRDAHPDDVAICLISGGGSALLPAPVEGVTLEEKQIVTKLLHSCGATINELNCVRKHLSRIKGGRLAEAFRGKLLIGFIISDVIGDPLDVIASGPTVSDTSTFANALGVLEKYQLRSQTPISIVQHLEAGCRGEIPETPKRLSNRVENIICTSNVCAVGSAGCEADQLGYHVYRTERDGYYINGVKIVGEAAAAMKPIIQLMRVYRGGPNWFGRFIDRLFKIKIMPTAILFGGETTVTLGPNPGKGGRNQEFVLAMLCELGEEGMKGVTILCAGTDGEDGPTDAAGAIGTEETLKRAKSLNLNPKDFLDRHDSYHFFEATGGLFKTGLTGTNVMDLGVILLH
jgi:hydroxypyruvate reductase/glycerate 2-kinase